MEFLHLLEGARTPFFDAFFSLITRMGEETFFLMVAIAAMWCLNKRFGYYLLTVGFLGLVLNMFLKLTFCVPRPWIIDPALTIVESAREMAAGYSFPSGHTQFIVGIATAAFLFYKNKTARIIAVVCAILVPFSRLYLGVHTPTDVLVSFAIAFFTAAALYIAFSNEKRVPKVFPIILICEFAIAVCYLLFVLNYKIPSNAAPSDIDVAFKTAYVSLFSLAALALAYFADIKVLRYSADAHLPVQIIKFVFGFLGIIAIRYLLKVLFSKIGFDGNLADGIRYFFMVAFAGILWPAVFTKIDKLYEKKRKTSV